MNNNLNENNSNIANYNPNTGTPIYGTQQNNNQQYNNPQIPNQNPMYHSTDAIIEKPKKKFPKIGLIILGIIVAFIILIVVIFSIVSSNSNKLICKSNEGNITIMYNDTTITGYTAVGISYDMEQQKTIANQIGINSYIQQFNSWFETNTSGTCTIQEK